MIKRDSDIEIDVNSRSISNLFMLEVERALNYALQPIVDMQTGEVFAFEALLRDYDKIGFDKPMSVYDHAHDLGCLGELEITLRRKALKAFSSVARSEDCRLFLNLDARVIDYNLGLIAETLQIIAQFQLQPKDLCFEILEVEDLIKAKAAKGFVKNARSLGFTIALDDFGVGYSQMRTMCEFDIDFIKTDGYFSSNLSSDIKKRLFIASAIRLAHTLGIRVIAEGVETYEDCAIIRDSGCDLVQGYFLAKPSKDVGVFELSYGEKLPRKRRLSKLGEDANLVVQTMLQLPVVQLSSPIDRVLTLFGENHETTIIPVVNEHNEPKGVIYERYLKRLIYLPFGQALLRNRSFNSHITDFMQAAPIADIETPLDQLLDMTSDGNGSCVVITRGGRYRGVLTASALLSFASEVRLREAADQNPLTKLPGNASILDHVRSSAVHSSEHRFFCYFDFDNFKPFNDTYGFRRGDRAIILFSNLLKQSAQKYGAFIGHIGGDDFFMGVSRHETDDVLRLVRELRAEFESQAASFYEANDRLRGYIEAEDRHGVKRRFKLLTVSVSVLELEAGQSFENADILGERIASLKSAAKKSSTGVVLGNFRSHYSCLTSPEFDAEQAAQNETDTSPLVETTAMKVKAAS